MSSLKQTPLTCSGHTRPVVDLAFSPVTEHGYFLISACKDGQPMLRQGDTGDWIGTFEGRKGAVWSATLNKDATLAATGAADFSAKLWDAVTGDEIQSFAHKHIVKYVNFSNDGKKLVTGSNEKLVRIFDLDDYEKEPLIFTGHTGSIKWCVFLHDDKEIVTVSEDKTIRKWDVETQTELKSIELDCLAGNCELSHDGNIITVPHGKKVTFLDSNSLEILNEFELPSQINTATLHPDKIVFVCGGEDFKMYKCDYATGMEIDSFKGHFGAIHCVRFSPDGEVYASGSEDGTLRLWQTTVGKNYGLWKYVVPDDNNGNGNGNGNSNGIENSLTKAEA